MGDKRSAGRAAEDVAARFLKDRGMRILKRNCHVKGGELDLVCREGDVLCVVEVRSSGPGSSRVPEADLSPGKVKRLSRSTARIIKKHRLANVPVRLDLLVVDWKQGRPEIRFHPGGIVPSGSY